MKDKITQAIYSIKNPSTNRTLYSEGRIKELSISQKGVEVTYSRDSISTENKKKIEDEIYKHLDSLVHEDKIFVKTISTSSSGVYSAKENEATDESDKRPSTQPKAGLKVGHGAVGNKKPISGVKHVIAVASGKGGVGKSTFSVNLAISLARRGFKTGLVDADIYGPSLPMMVGKRNETPRSNSEKKIIPVQTHGIGFISFGLFIEESDAVIWRGPMLGGVLNQFLFDVDWNGYDFLIIDLPPGTGDIQLSMVQNAEIDGAIIISTPQDISLLDAKKGLAMFQKLNVPIIGMVENMSHFICDGCGKEHDIFGSGGVDKSSKELDVEFLGSVPLEMDLRKGSDSGVPFMSQIEHESRPTWQAFEGIVSRLTAKFGTGKEVKKGFLAKILKKSVKE